MNLGVDSLQSVRFGDVRVLGALVFGPDTLSRPASVEEALARCEALLEKDAGASIKHLPFPLSPSGKKLVLPTSSLESTARRTAAEVDALLRAERSYSVSQSPGLRGDPSSESPSFSRSKSPAHHARPLQEHNGDMGSPPSSTGRTSRLCPSSPGAESTRASGYPAGDLSSLIHLLESAPSGPIELDPGALYSPESTRAHSRRTSLSSLPHAPEWQIDLGHASTDTAPTRPSRASTAATQSHACPAQPAPGFASRLAARRAARLPRNLPPAAPAIPLQPARRRLSTPERALIAARQRTREAQNRAAMERLVQQIQRDREKECTFKPQLVSEPEKHLPPSYRPVHLLVDAAVRSYSKHSAPTPPSPPFRPQLNARSRALAEQLAASAAQGLTRPTFRPRTAPEEHAFCPTIAPASAKLVEDSGRFPAEFGERQRFYERQRSQAARESALEALRALSFEPRTTGSNPAAVLALSSDRFGILAESAEERAQRMSVEEPRRQEERLRRRRAEEEGKLTFAPALDPRSRKIGRDSNLEELTSWQARARRQEERAAQAVAEREAQCTFRPRLVSQPWTPVEESERGPPSPGSKGGAPTRLLARARAMEAEKDRRQLELRRQAAEREEKECTFRPQLSSLRKHQQRGGEEECLLVSPGGGYEQLQAGHEGSRRPSSPTARSPGSPPRPRVAGLDAFMAHKARAEALKKAAEERRNEVFGIGVELRPARIGATVPRARALATEQRAALPRRFSVAEIEAARRAAECTFRPNLDKGTDRRRVLDQHSTPVAASSHLPGEEEDEWDFRSSEWGAAGAESVDRGVGRVGSERFGRRASLGSEACWEGLSASWAGARSAGDCVHGD